MMQACGECVDGISRQKVSTMKLSRLIVCSIAGFLVVSSISAFAMNKPVRSPITSVSTHASSHHSTPIRDNSRTRTVPTGKKSRGIWPWSKK